MRKSINTGLEANDGTGTPLRTAMQWINQNFAELYDRAYLSSKLVLLEEKFIGDGSTVDFVLSGNINNATISQGSWSASRVKTSKPANVVGSTYKPIYDSLIPVIRIRIDAISISSTGHVLLNKAPRNGVEFSILYYYELNDNDLLDNYYTPEFVSKEEKASKSAYFEIDAPILTSEQVVNIPNPNLGKIVFCSDIDSEIVYTSIGWLVLQGDILWIRFLYEDFESGLPASMQFVNDSNNYWIVGSDKAQSGTKSAYITRDGTTAGYRINTARISHLVWDVDLENHNRVMLAFDWLCNGEVNYDFGRVYIAPPNYLPTAGSYPNGVGVSQIGFSQYNDVSTIWEHEEIDLGNVIGNKRIIFTFRNDGSVGSNPAFVIDNPTLKYQ